ncbi:MAG TPA: hypothetical protein VFH11_03590 [Gemmatimonadota bacterium]|nr:hypothetical protein [Gemmatimonadota bacterium]
MKANDLVAPGITPVAPIEGGVTAQTLWSRERSSAYPAALVQVDWPLLFIDTVTLTALPFSNDVGSVLPAAAALSVPKFTEMEDEPLFPSELAVIVAVPCVLPVTVAVLPVPNTVATVVLLLDQAIVRPVRMFPFASRKVAVRLTVPFWVVMIAEEGETVTVETADWTTTRRSGELRFVSPVGSEGVAISVLVLNICSVKDPSV